MSLLILRRECGVVYSRGVVVNWFWGRAGRERDSALIGRPQ